MRDPKGPVKPYKSPQEIAKSHKVSLQSIMKQVKMGTKVEGEHTTSKSGAKITALQHVDELPNYYTKLKKVEKMKESLEDAKAGLEGKRYCKLCRKSECESECKFGPEMWRKFSIATVHPANMPEEYMDEKRGLWDNIHTRKKKGLPPKKPGEKGYPKTLDIDEGLKQARKNVGASKCWPGKVAKGTKMKGGIEVPNCKPAEDTCLTFSQFMVEAKKKVKIETNKPIEWKIEDIGPGKKVVKTTTSKGWKEELEISEVAAWQKKEGKNPSGGLNEKGRKSYERENPGSNLQAPQPEGGPRKRSFCARMGGMPGPMKDEKGRPTRKALSLRKWKC